MMPSTATPTKPHALADSLDVGFLEPVNDQAFKQCGESRSRFSPGNAYLMNAMLGALGSWNIRNQYCLELAGIQMPPLPTLGIVTSASFATLRATQS